MIKIVADICLMDWKIRGTKMIYISLLIGMWVTSPLVQKTAKIGRKYRGDKIYVVSWGVILLSLIHI